MVNHSIKLTMLFVLAFFLQAVGGQIEGRFFPVVEGAEVTRVDDLSEGFSRIWGSFTILRPGCDFRGLDWQLVGANRNVSADLIFEEGTKERAGGVNDFGPWRIQLTPEQLQQRSVAIVYHACPYRWWITETRFYP